MARDGVPLLSCDRSLCSGRRWRRDRAALGDPCRLRRQAGEALSAAGAHRQSEDAVDLAQGTSICGTGRVAQGDCEEGLALQSQYPKANTEAQRSQKTEKSESHSPRPRIVAAWSSIRVSRLGLL